MIELNFIQLECPFFLFFVCVAERTIHTGYCAIKIFCTWYLLALSSKINFLPGNDGDRDLRYYLCMEN